MPEERNKETKPSSISKILGQVSRGFRRRSPLKTSKDSTTRQNQSVSSKENVSSPLQKIRMSFRKKHKINKELTEQHNSIEETSWSKASPRPALSENDLRNITIRRGTEMPATPLAGATHFMSEVNLSDFTDNTPINNESRVPSYVKISCALNGYRSPAALVENTPIRPPGKGLVERRLAQLCGPSKISTDFESSPMGSTCSSPSVKNLIGQFDRWKLCVDLHDTEVKENVKPSPITSQPMESKCKISAVPSTSTEVANSTVSVNQSETATSSARSGTEFKETLVTTRSSLEDRCTLALHELDTISMPEQAADSIRVASGKANLLIHKKLAKFEELVNANLYPELSSKVTTAEDLEGYWALVEMELADINNCFSEVEKWRALKYNAVPETPVETGTSERNNNSWRKPRTVTKPTVAAKPLTEKQKALAEQRKKSIAEARAKSKLNQQKNNASPGLMIL